jgi:hypothetical protein
MKRRDVIKLGALAAAGAASAPSCAVPRKLSTLEGADGAAAFNTMLDDHLGRLKKPGLLQRLVADHVGKTLSQDVQEKIASHDVLFRRMLSTILLTQGFRDLPQATQYEPAVQDRMWSHSDLISSMVFDVSDMLANLDVQQRKEVQRRLQAEPDLPMMLGQMLDEKAGAVGLSRTRRIQLRSMMKQAAFRLRTQHPSTVIDEYVAKVERLRPTTAADGTTITLAEELGEREFWRQQRMRADDPASTPMTPASGSAAGSGAGSASGAGTGNDAGSASGAESGSGAGSGSGTGSGSTDMASLPLHQKLDLLLGNARAAAARGECRTVTSLGRYILELDRDYFKSTFAADPELAACVRKVAKEDRETRARAPVAPPEPPTATSNHYPGQAGVRAGGYMLGIGAITFVISVLGLSAGAFPFIFGATAGVLLVGLGLLVLLISGLVYAVSSKD